MASDVVVVDGNGPRTLLAAVVAEEEAAAVAAAGGTGGGGAEWDSLGTGDLSALGIASCVGVVIAIVVLHVACNKAWPPYRTVIPELVVYTGLAVSRYSKIKINPKPIYVVRIKPNK